LGRRRAITLSALILRLIQRLQGHEHASLVLRGVAADKCQHIVHRRIFLHDPMNWSVLAFME
jgi:hypothetical protein